MQKEGPDTEEMMGENWRQSRVQRGRDEEQHEEHPSKKRRRGQYGGRVDWGLTELSKEEVERGAWLQVEARAGDKDIKVQSRQSTLKPWSGTRLMARELIMEVIRKVLAPPTKEEGNVVPAPVPYQEGGDRSPLAPTQEITRTSQMPAQGEKSSNKKMMAQQESDMVKTAENIEL